MPVFILLLRGVNVGGHQRLTNDTLRAACERIGCTAARTYLQSGNVVVKTSVTRIAQKLQEALGVDVIARTAAEMRMIVEHNPLLGDDRPPNKLHVLFLSAPLPEKGRAAMEKARADHELIAFADREVYLFFGEGAGRSKLAALFTEKRLGVNCTARNWNTVTALRDLADEIA